MSEVFMCERGQLDNRSKADLRKAGIVVVEVVDMSKAQFIRATETVSGGDMLYAAMDALRYAPSDYGKSNGKDQRNRLAWNIIKLTTADTPAALASTNSGSEKP